MNFYYFICADNSGVITEQREDSEDHHNKLEWSWVNELRYSRKSLLLL